MTEKELLYLEDAVEHQRIIISILENMNFEDEDLKAFKEDEIKNHEQVKEGLLNLLEAKANEW